MGKRSHSRWKTGEHYMDDNEIADWFKQYVNHENNALLEDFESIVGKIKTSISMPSELRNELDEIADTYFDGNISKCMTASVFLLTRVIDDMINTDIQ